MMNRIIETFAPSGKEGQMRTLLSEQLKGKFDEIIIDNIGNLVATSGTGELCIECGMDTVGVMIVSTEDNRAWFSAVGNVTPKALAGKTIVFKNGHKGTVAYDEETELKDAKISDLYLETDDELNIGDFGVIQSDFSEADGGYCGIALSDRIGIAAVCRAIENIDEVRNVTVLFSAQKRLGGRGISAFFGNKNFEKVITIDGCSEDGLAIVAKDEKTASSLSLRREIENVAEKKAIFCETVVSEKNFCMGQIVSSCGASCVALGIPVLNTDDDMQRVSKADFDSAVTLIEHLLTVGI